jgi:hypothetical protein
MRIGPSGLTGQAHTDSIACAAPPLVEPLVEKAAGVNDHSVAFSTNSRPQSTIIGAISILASTTRRMRLPPHVCRTPTTSGESTAQANVNAQPSRNRPECSELRAPADLICGCAHNRAARQRNVDDKHVARIDCAVARTCPDLHADGNCPGATLARASGSLKQIIVLTACGSRPNWPVRH